MATIAREKQIPYGSAIFQAGEAQFRSNMDDLLTKYQRVGIPVFIGTLASNERDQSPFISAIAPNTDSTLWTNAYQQAVQAFDAGDLETATTALAEAMRLDDTSADAYYLQGHLFEARGEYDAAQKAYLAAKDRDQLRFRAPEVFNDVIRQLAQAHAAQLVDVQAVLRKEAKNGIIGADLMLEHLHPNLRGYFLLADAYYAALRQRGMIGAWDHPIPEEVAWEEVPLTEVDLLFAQYKIEQLLSDYPYKKTSTKPNIPEPTNEVQQLANDMYFQRGSWLEHMMALLDYYRKQEDYANSLKVALIVAEAVPFDAGYQSMAGQLLLLQGKPDQALRYLFGAVSLSGGDPDMFVDLAKAYHLTGQDDLARAALIQALRINPNHVEAQGLLSALDEQTQAP
jgi:Flp pilus assembly protein TadD